MTPALRFISPIKTSIQDKIARTPRIGKRASRTPVQHMALALIADCRKNVDLGAQDNVLNDIDVAAKIRSSRRKSFEGGGK